MNQNGQTTTGSTQDGGAGKLKRKFKGVTLMQIGGTYAPGAKHEAVILAEAMAGRCATPCAKPCNPEGPGICG